jgi:hypothetical protein
MRCKSLSIASLAYQGAGMMMKTVLERAFEPAKTGGFQKMRELRRRLQEEGYNSSQIEGPVLMQQLREMSKAARAARDASTLEYSEKH